MDLTIYGDTDLPGQELVFNLSLSEESAAIARALLQKWMSPETTFDEMSEYLRHNVPQQEAADDSESHQ